MTDYICSFPTVKIIWNWHQKYAMMQYGMLFENEYLSSDVVNIFKNRLSIDNLDKIVGNNVIISTMIVVTHDIPNDVVVAGIPASVIKLE